MTTDSFLDTHDPPVLVAVVFGITRYRTQLFAIAAQHLGIECVLAAATVAEGLHHWIDFLFKHFGELWTIKHTHTNYSLKLNYFDFVHTYLGTIAIHARRLAIVEPRIVEHLPHIVHILPRVRVLAHV